jgi:hypothetical protein
MFSKIGDLHQRRSWRLGYLHGRAGQTQRPPWWADAEQYTLGFVLGQGGPHSKDATSEKSGTTFALV